MKVWVVTCILLGVAILVVVGIYLYRKRKSSKDRFMSPTTVYVDPNSNWIRNFVKYTLPRRTLTDDRDEAPVSAGALGFTTDRVDIAIGGEPWPLTNSDSAVYINTTKRGASEVGGKPYIYVPFYALSFAERERPTSPFDLLTKRDYPKTKFCAYMYSNCDTNKYDGVRERERFFDILNARKHVDSLGKCKNGTQALPRSGNGWDRAIELYKPYKFVICFENTVLDGYVTEKIVNAMLAGAIPIYFGSPDIAEHFNPRSFINVQKFRSLEECADYVLHVDQDDHLYMSILSQSWLNTSKLGPYFEWFTGGEFYRRLEKAVPTAAPFPKYSYDQVVQIIAPYQCPKISSNWVVINLDKSVDRWNNIVSITQPIPPEQRPQRFPAVYGKDMIDQFGLYYTRDWQRTKPPQPGEIGVFLSNMLIWNQLIESSYEYVMVMEDDSRFDGATILRDVSDSLAKIPKDWDILFLGVCELFCRLYDLEQIDGFYKMAPGCMPCTFGYIMRKRAAMYLLINALPMTSPVDNFLEFHSGNLNIYIMDPQVLSENTAFETTIVGRH